MTVYENTNGDDIELLLNPDTTRNWQRISPEVLTAIDRLAIAAAALDPDWQIDLAIGWDTASTINLTAAPATTMETAA